MAGRTMMFPQQKQIKVRQRLIRGMNPRPIATYARIIPLDQAAKCQSHRRQPFREPCRQHNLLSPAILTWSQCPIPSCHCAIVSLSYCPSGYLPIARCSHFQIRPLSNCPPRCPIGAPTLTTSSSSLAMMCCTLLFHPTPQNPAHRTKNAKPRSRGL